MLEKYFKIRENNSTIRTEILAGLTTFMTMAYILAVNPDILGASGMDKGGVFTATVLSSLIATLAMALLARLPIAVAPGMGLNAFFAFTVVLGMKHSWQFALTAVFIEGIIFIILTAFNIREMIVNSIPVGLKHAISAGIGLFIAFLGLQNAGIIVSHPVTLVALGNITNIQEHPGAVMALVTLILSGVLLALRVKGALLIGIFAGTLMGIPLGITRLPDSFNFLPPSLSPVFLKFEWTDIFTVDMLYVVLTFLFVDIFDTVGTLVGVASKANMLDANGHVPRVKQALFADAIGTTTGAMLGTSALTAYVESAAGVAEGGRTGLTALVVSCLFFIALFLSPFFLMIPGAATAPALILVGAMMITPIKNINFDDFTETIPAFLTIIMMPMTQSISEGILFGVLSFTFLKILTGKFRDLSLMTLILAILFLLKFLM
jgi:adenine/guanine/hypoxanthine permease